MEEPRSLHRWPAGRELSLSGFQTPVAGSSGHSGLRKKQMCVSGTSLKQLWPTTFNCHNFFFVHIKKIAYNSTHGANFKTLNDRKMVSNLLLSLFPAYILLLTLHNIMLINIRIDLNCDITLTCKFDGKYHFSNG